LDRNNFPFFYWGENVVKYKYHRLEETFEEELKEFFAVIFEWRVQFETRVLQDNEYNKVHNKRSGAFVRTAVVKGDPKAKNLLLRDDRVERTVFIRERDKGVLPRSLVHEVLHIYYPQLKEKTIEDADDVFEMAFLCYDSLYHDQPQRDFFLELCRSEDKLRKWAGLPKFDAGEVSKYELRLLEQAKKS